MIGSATSSSRCKGSRSAPEKVPAGVNKRFRHYDQSQSFLLPPSLDDWLPENHEARFISDVVDNLLDLSCIYDSYTEASGAPPYDPTMMLKLLLFAYSIGVTSSREMERRCHTDVAFRWLSANEAPDYRSISRFRRRHLGAIDALFVQVLALCAEAGLVNLGRVALDGTKLRASASKHKAMSHDRIGPRSKSSRPRWQPCWPRPRPPTWPKTTSSVRTNGVTSSRRTGHQRGPPGQAACRQGSHRGRGQGQGSAKSPGQGHRTRCQRARGSAAGAAAAELAAPPGRAQRNFTDPESRMMKTTDGFHYAYNAQAVVDEEAQVIVAHRCPTRPPTPRS